MKRIETAVFLCAGMGRRLEGLAGNNPKGFLEIEGKSLIERSVENLINAGIKQFYFGTGYQSSVYENFAQSLNAKCIKNEDYATTGSMYTLYAMRKDIKEDFLLLESDLLYDPYGIEALLKDNHEDAILASGMTHSNDEVFIELDSKSQLLNLSKIPSDLKAIDAELVGISKISYATFLSLCDIAKDLFSSRPKIDYEHVFIEHSKKSPLFVEKLEDFVWCEIDDEQAYQRALELIYPALVKN